MKVTIIGGAGGVGSSVAFNLLRGTDPAAFRQGHGATAASTRDNGATASSQGPDGASAARTRTALEPFDVVIVDRKQNMVTSHVMDLQDVVSLGGAASVRAGTPDDARDSDIVVMAAGVPTTANTDRRVFFGQNARIVADVVEPLAASGWGGVMLLMTNPVDAHVTRLVARGLLPRERVIGYTLNDSLRMRTGIASALGVAPQSVDAWVLGEHGSGQVPLWGRITVDGRPATLTDAQRREVTEYMDTWYVTHVALDSGRASTWSSGLGGALMVEAIARGDGSPVPASVVLTGEYGISDAALGMPTLLGPEGVRDVLEWPLEAGQAATMAATAGEIRELAASAG